MGELHIQMHTMMRGGKSQGLLMIFGYTCNVNLQSASARLGNLGMFLNLSINLTLFFSAIVASLSSSPTPVAAVAVAEIDGNIGGASGSDGGDFESREAALLGKRAHFECSVRSPNNAAELEIWWQFKEANISNSVRYQVRYDGREEAWQAIKPMRSSVSHQPEILFSEVKPKQKFDSGNLEKKGRTVAAANYRPNSLTSKWEIFIHSTLTTLDKSPFQNIFVGRLGLKHAIRFVKDTCAFKFTPSNHKNKENTTSRKDEQLCKSKGDNYHTNLGDLT